MASRVDADYIAELFCEFGPVSVRRMFGGAGLFADGVMIGLVAGGVIYLKADENSLVDFQREGCGPFRYATAAGERSLRSYWKMPDRLYDDPEELARWARAALAAARNGMARTRPNKKSPRRRSARVRKVSGKSGANKPGANKSGAKARR